MIHEIDDVSCCLRDRKRENKHGNRFSFEPRYSHDKKKPFNGHRNEYSAKESRLQTNLRTVISFIMFIQKPFAPQKIHVNISVADNRLHFSVQPCGCVGAPCGEYSL